MDQARLDQLARGLASGISRRGMFRNLSGVALGGILLVVGTSEAATKKKKHGRGKRKPRPILCLSCNAGCPEASENNPTKTVVFIPASDSDYCAVKANLTGFAGCTSHTAEYWSAIKTSGTRAQYYGDVTLGPTDLSGFSQTTLGSFAKGGAVDIRFPGAAADYHWVEC